MLLEQTCVLCKQSGSCTAKGSSAFGMAPVWTGHLTQDSGDSSSSGHCQVDKEQQGRRTMFQQMKSLTKQVFWENVRNVNWSIFFSINGTRQGQNLTDFFFFLSPLIPILVHTFKHLSYKLDTGCYCEGMYLPQRIQDNLFAVEDRSLFKFYHLGFPEHISIYFQILSLNKKSWPFKTTFIL